MQIVHACVALDFLGVNVCGEVSTTLCNSTEEWEWKGYGLKLRIPEKGILLADTKQCAIHIKASLSGNYQLPEENHLVSPIYWFTCDPPCNFKKPIIIEIEHCATSKNIPKLSFVKSAEGPCPHVFEPVKGNFNTLSSFGILEINHFCGIGVTSNGSDIRKYLSSILYKLERGNPVRIDFYFVVTWNLDIHRTVRCTEQLL